MIHAILKKQIEMSSVEGCEFRVASAVVAVGIFSGIASCLGCRQKLRGASFDVYIIGLTRTTRDSSCNKIVRLVLLCKLIEKEPEGASNFAHFEHDNGDKYIS